ncbi:hypothetical protein Pcinc_020447 [Petrolisthes cinctipes]|nr:hypothetical protein Pcinc_020447 [Petrolisthes cinctipes]
MGDDKCIAVGLKEFRANSSPIKENISPSQVLPADPCLSAELCKTLEYCDTHSEDTIENFHVPDNESEGFHYVLGYIVHKFQNKYPNLGTDVKSSGDWMSLIDNGGLKRMAPEFISKFEVAENLFRKSHGDELKENGPGLQKMTELVTGSLPDVPQEVVKLYLWCRLQIRIKSLNRTLKAENVRNKYKKLSKVAG